MSLYFGLTLVIFLLRRDQAVRQGEGVESIVDLSLINAVPHVAEEEGVDYLICHYQLAG